MLQEAEFVDEGLRIVGDECVWIIAADDERVECIDRVEVLNKLFF